MSINILSVKVKQLIDKIEIDSTKNNTIFVEILEQLKNVLQYIKYSDIEITRLNNENTKLNSDLVKIQLELLEYKNKEKIKN